MQSVYAKLRVQTHLQSIWHAVKGSRVVRMGRIDTGTQHKNLRCRRQEGNVFSTSAPWNKSANSQPTSKIPLLFFISTNINLLFKKKKTKPKPALFLFCLKATTYQQNNCSQLMIWAWRSVKRRVPPPRTVGVWPRSVPLHSLQLWQGTAFSTFFLFSPLLFNSHFF